MRIKSIRIQNFRSFEDETVFLDGYNCFVGANGSGKSTILCALNIFFRDTFHSDHTLLTEEDFHCKNTSYPIEITVTFNDLNAEAQEEFSHYVRQEELSVTAKAVYDPDSRQAEVKQYGERKGNTAFVEFFANQSKSKDELKQMYDALKVDYPDLSNQTTKSGMIEGLRKYEEEHPGECELIPSSDEFYGFTKGANRLEKHVLWVYVPAVKDASNEQIEGKDTALGKLLALTIRSSIDFAEALRGIKSQAQEQYRTMLQENTEHLSSLSESLMTRLQQWSHPEVRLNLGWKNDPDKSLKIEPPLVESILGEGAFDGELKRFGHGLQRSYLLALLQELADRNTEHSPTLILGCEEPELYQHPPQAQHLASILRKLSLSNSQILLSTHAPYFVSGRDFEDVRYVSCDHTTNETTVTNVDYSEIASAVASARGETMAPPEGMIAKIHQALQPHISEMFFTRTLILVEGMEDIAYITTYLHLMDLWDEYRRYGCHMVHVDNKNNLFNPVAIAKKLGIPHYVVFDADGDKQSDPDGRGEKHRKDNVTILNLCGADSSTPFPTANCQGDNYMMWAINIGEGVKADFDDADYTTAKNQAHLVFGQDSDLKKNSLFIAELLTNLWNADHKSANLQRLCDAIINFARDAQEQAAPETAESETTPVTEEVVSTTS